MRSTIVFVTVLSTVLATACMPGAPTSAPATATGGGAGATAEWDRVLAAAKTEGTVSVIGPTGDDRRAVLTTPFEKQYGIRVEYLADPGPAIGPKLSSERQAGQYLWDVFIGGTTTGLETLVPTGSVDPLEPALLLPDVKDPKTWRGGAMELLGAGKQLVVMTPFHRGTIFINPSQVKAEEITSYRDLLDPKWKGKLLMDDPKKAGAGQATFTFFYRHPDLGPDFIRALAKQEPTISRDYPQQIDSLGQGKFPVLIGSSDALAEQRIKQGVPITIMDPRQIKEGSDVSPASGSAALFNRAPHPNAAKVYLNWLLSKEGQTEFARGTGYVSSRLDVPTDHAPSWRVPRPNAVKTYDQEAIDLKSKIAPLLNEVFPQS